MAQSEAEAAPAKLSLWDALKDFGWFPLLFAAVVGGPSVLAILEAVFVQHQLIAGLQWIVDGYHRVMSVLGAVLEPMFHPAIAWLSANIHMDLKLDPVWRPLFTLGCMLLVGFIRGQLSEKGKTSARDVLEFGGPTLIGLLIGSIAAGLVTNVQSWWTQGLTGALPVLGLFFFFALLQTISAWRSGPLGMLRELIEDLGLMLLLSAGVFAIGAGLSFVPIVGAHSGIIAFALFVTFMGISTLDMGLKGGDRGNARGGLIILGGFGVAGIVLAADYALKTFWHVT